MQVFDITNRKEFMAKLLKSDLFESFEVKEVISHTAFKLIIDGKRNKEYFNDIQNEIDTTINIFELSSQEAHIHKNDVTKIINQSFYGLTEREEFVLRMRIGIGLDEALSLEEIGSKIKK